MAKNGAPKLASFYDGLGATHDGDMHLTAVGHMYEMTAHNDPVAHFNAFGPSPENIPGFTHLETGATTTLDGTHRDGATGHSEYPRVGNDGQNLRTPGWNTAMIVAGLPEQAKAAGPHHSDAMGNIMNGIEGLFK